MATYIKGVTDYIPQIQPFRPDFNFYQNVLARKQQQYDQGWSKVNSLYNSLLNAPMTRPEDIAKRDDFFKRAEFEIKRISGVDLSNPTNIDAAYKLFKPYYTDKNIIHDMNNTKSAMNNYQKGNALRYETDEKKGAGTFWQGGLDYIDLWRKKYSESNNEDALRMSAPQYTPFFDTRKHMMADIKENKFEMIRESGPGGKIKMKYKNGAMMIPSLSTYYEGVYANNPQAQQYYKVKAELDQYSWMENNKANYQNEDEAENAYISETLNSVIKSQNNLRDEIKSDTENVDYLSNVYSDYAEKYGGRPYLEEIKGQLAQQKDALNKSSNSLKSVNLILNNGDKVDLSTYKGRSAALKATMLMRQDVLSASQSYATLTSEESWEYDEKWMADYKAGLDIKTYKKKKLIDLELERIEAEKQSQGGLIDNILDIIQNPFGNAEGDLTYTNNLKAIEGNKESVKQLEKNESSSFIRASLKDAAMSDQGINTSLTAFTNILLKGAFDKDTRAVGNSLKKKLKAIQYELMNEYSNSNTVSQKSLDAASTEYINLIGKHINIREISSLANAAVSDGGKLNGIGWYNMLANDASPLKTWYKDNYSKRNQIKFAKDALETSIDIHDKGMKDAFVKLQSSPDLVDADKMLLERSRDYDFEGESSIDFLEKGSFPSEEQFISAYLNSVRSYDDRWEKGPGDLISGIGRGLGYLKDELDVMVTSPFADKESESYRQNYLGKRALLDPSAARQVYELENINIAKEKYKNLKDKLVMDYGQIVKQIGFDTPGESINVPGISYRGSVNAHNTKSENSQEFLKLSSDMIANFGDASMDIRVGRPGAGGEALEGVDKVPPTIVEQLIRDVFNKDLNPLDKDGQPKYVNHPSLNWTFYGVAQNDPNKVAIYIQPNANYIATLAKGTKDSEAGDGSQGPFYNSQVYENLSGFTVYMDRNSLKVSDLAKQVKASDVDILLQNGREVNINNFPSAGNVSFQKGSLTQTNSGTSFSDNGNNVIASYLFKGYTFSEGKIIEKTPITQYVDIGPIGGVDSDIAVNQASNYLFRMSQNNMIMKNLQTALDNGKMSISDVKKILGISNSSKDHYSEQMQGLSQNNFTENNMAEDFLLGGFTNE